MTENLHIEQKIKKGNESTNIGVQNNYYGLTPKEACEMAMGLFYDNFPKLQKQAKEVVEKRVTELMNEIAVKLYRDNITDMSPLAYPDVQYVVYEAQKNYARFSTPDLLSKLSSLIVERIKHNDDDMCLKVAIDQAISVIGMLSSSQLDHLSKLFLTTKVRFKNIESLERLKRHFDYLDNTFSKSKNSNWQHLNMLGCLQLDLPDVCKYNAKIYGFNVSDVEKICPKNIKDFSGDYSTSPIGTIIAIIHAEQKTDFHFDPKIWIHD